MLERSSFVKLLGGKFSTDFTVFLNKVICFLIIVDFLEMVKNPFVKGVEKDVGQKIVKRHGDLLWGKTAAVLKEEILIIRFYCYYNKDETIKKQVIARIGYIVIAVHAPGAFLVLGAL